MKYTQRTILIAALLMAGATGAAAQEGKFVKHLSDRVAVESKTRYSDLVKFLFRDFSVGEQEATATKTIPLRHVSRDHDKMPLTGDFHINTLDTVRIRDNGGPIIIVELDIESDNDSDFVYAGRASILAAFRIRPKPQLLDALDVKSDRWTEILREKAVLAIGPNQDAVLIVNNHSNSSDSYDILTPFFVNNGRSERMFDLFLYNSSYGCGVDFEEKETFFSLPDPENEYFKVGVRVLFRRKRDREDCVPRLRGYSRIYTGVYAWNKAAGRFRLAGGNLGLLDKFNRKGPSGHC